MRNSTDRRQLEVTRSAINHGRLSLCPAKEGFFPDDVFGGSTKDLPGNLVEIRARGLGQPVLTDLPTDQNGKPRWFFRDRPWVKNFIRHFNLREGDTVNLTRIGKREYLLDAVPETLTFIDLFAGIGGIRMAYESTGAKCVFSSEWNRFAAQTYEANFGDAPHGDITKIDAGDIPDHDILVAGFPCQPFSIAGVSKKNSLGKAHGFKDETQGTLFFDIVRILEEKQPRAFMLENVRNLKSHDKGRTYAVIRRNLERLGYLIQDEVINSSVVVPQKRQRVFIVGTKPGLRFHFPTEEELLCHRQAACIGDILEAKVDPKYILTEHLWNYLQDYKKKHRASGNGFGFGLVGHDSISRTISARYYKDGSEILVDRGDGKCPRMLTERECARLMGFPDTFVIPVSKTQAYKQFGNSVVVPVVTAVAEQLVGAIRKNELVDRIPELLRV
jgi:DNA (cytosine-5)-methyltransferase 1